MKKELGDGLDEGDIDCKKVTTLTSADLSKMVSNLDGNTTIDKIILENGKVKELEITSNTKEVVYNNGKMEVQDDEETEELEVATITQDVDTIGNVVYYNVTTGSECTATDEAANTETNAGCMKFYVLDNTDANTVDLILDHTVGEMTPIISNEDHAKLKGQTYEEHVVQGCPEGISLEECQVCGPNESFYLCQEFGPVTILNKLNELTTHYKGTQIVPDTEEFAYTDSTYNYTVSMAGLKARFMTRDEFIDVNGSVNVNNCGYGELSNCQNSNGLDIKWLYEIDAYFVFPLYNFNYYGGYLFEPDADGSATYIRPVITLNKAA